MAQDSRLTIHDILKQYWGFDSFRPLQEDIISNVLDRNDCLALMPTGGGKSLCYQVPAMAKDGTCLVISPLIALMKDQVENLRKKGITAYAIFSGMSRKEVINVLKVVTESNCKFLYVSPERLETALFKEYLPGMGISLIAVDEAHCISQWGYDFRPPYLRIATLRDELPNVPILALTASATEEVQKDICEKLTAQKSSTEWKVFRQSFERPNLSFSVFTSESKINKAIEIINKVNDSGIIYCRSRQRTKEISELLLLRGINAAYYHAGLQQEERNKKQEDWIQDKTRIIVCTNAFGMGIDKPNVRFVIHADVPDSLENYYQEAGRAGRDGKKSYAVLLYDENDITSLQEMPNIRFPSLEDIRTVYQAVANYLQLHNGDGEQQYFNFDLTDFIKRFKLQSQLTLYSLKALEQDGWVSYNEQVFLSSSIRFTTNKKQLYEFEQSHPQYEPLIKTLLRAYEGIFDGFVYISEKMLAGYLKIDVEVIKQELSILHQHGLIEYVPQKDSPQLFFLKSRIAANELHINRADYNKRKEAFVKRIGTIINYVKNKNICRSRIIGNYFGDMAIGDCGICDNCLQRKRAGITEEDFAILLKQIKDLLQEKPLHSSVILEKLTGFKKDKAWKLIEFLQAENKIEVDSNGYVQLK